MPAVTVDDITVLPPVPVPDPGMSRQRPVTGNTTAPRCSRGRGSQAVATSPAWTCVTLTRSSTSTRWAGSTPELQGATSDYATMREFDAPSYRQDVEDSQGIPEGAAEMRCRLDAGDAFVIASPEYNAAMPGMLKNSIDWASRFRPQPFNGRHCMLLSASPSMVGGNRGLWSLRVPLEHLGARVYPDMFSLAQAPAQLTVDRQLDSQEVHERLLTTLSSFLDIVEATRHYPCADKTWVEFLGEQPTPATSRAE
jgi:chromate reductase